MVVSLLGLRLDPDKTPEPSTVMTILGVSITLSSSLVGIWEAQLAIDTSKQEVWRRDMSSALQSLVFSPSSAESLAGRLEFAAWPSTAKAIATASCPSTSTRIGTHPTFVYMSNFSRTFGGGSDFFALRSLVGESSSPGTSLLLSSSTLMRRDQAGSERLSSRLSAFMARLGSLTRALGVSSALFFRDGHRSSL